MIGDSLNVGVEPHLAAALPGWRIVSNDRVGRTTPEGIDELEAGRPALSSYVVVSLGTNDAPDRVTAFRSDVAHVLDLVGPSRCVIWATIWRDGAPGDAFNAVLRDAVAANRRLRLIEWAEMVQAASRLARRRPAARQRGRLPRACPSHREGREGLRAAADRDRAMSRTEPPTGAERALQRARHRSPSCSSTAARRRRCPAPGARRASCSRPSSHRASRTSRSPRCATGSSPGTSSTRAWRTRGRRSTVVARPSLLVGFSMGGAVSIGVAAHPAVDRRARPRAVDPRAALARRRSAASGSTCSMAPGTATCPESPG